MKQQLLRRIMALLLALSFIVSSGIVISSAAGGEGSGEGESGSVTNTTLDDVRELLDSSNYADYRDSEIFKSTGNATAPITIHGVDYNKETTTAKVKRVKVDNVTGKVTVVADDYVAVVGEVLGVYTPSTGEITFNVDIPETAKYSIKIEYFPITELFSENGDVVESDKSASVERILKINGTIPFTEARYLTLTKVWKNTYQLNMNTASTVTDENGKVTKTYVDITPYVEAAKRAGLEYKVADDKSYIVLYLPDGGWTEEIVAKMDAADFRLFTEDIDGNEIRCSMERVPEWRVYNCKDVDGFSSESFEFVFEKGANTITLQSKSQAMVLGSISLVPHESVISYDDLSASYSSKGFANGNGTLKFEAEYPFASSSQTIYPLEDASSAMTSPADTTKTVLNIVGGEKWQTAGQWVRYNFTVSEDGLYNIVSRFRQNIHDGMFSSRVLYIYSDGLSADADGYYNGLPCAEAANIRFDYKTDWQVQPLGYSKKTGDKWERVNFNFYFKAGVTYSIELEVALGDMGDIVNQVSTSLQNINSYYLNIIKLTGADPDTYRDYGFYRIMPDTMQGLIIESRRLKNIMAELVSIAGEKSSNAATLERISWLLEQMGTDEDNVAKFLDQLKSYIGTLGTWISDAKTQPLELDYFVVQSPEAKLPKAKANFFQAVWHEVCRFVQSFIRNYNRMGATSKDDKDNKSVEVWLAYGRDQTQVIRNLVNNQFTPETGYLVDLKLVAGGTLLPSILAKSGPDVYIGLGEDTIINYAIRGALMNIENYEGFYDLTSQYVMVKKTVSDLITEYENDNYIINGKGTATVKAMSSDGVAMYTVNYSADGTGEVLDRNGKVKYRFDKDGSLYETGANFDGGTYIYQYKTDAEGKKIVNDKVQFNDAAMYVLGIADAQNTMHYYGLPETQGFSMMFCRNDILADLGLDIPKTWDDIEAAIPVLQAKNMQIGMSNDYKIFLYQKGGELFADQGMRINLDSNVALDSFDYMCNLFTMYSFPYKYDFANRFRTGEMPIGIAGYNGTYNHLVVFATEIRGLWSFYPLPGVATYAKDDNGDFIYEDGKKVVESINNMAVSGVSAISMINGCDVEDGAWEFMKWHVGQSCQVNYSNEMVAILGDSAKHSTANITALESMPWTTAEYEQLNLQFKNLASIPNYPGSYIIGRYTQFAFLAAYDDLASPTEELLKYINTINKEITRKREEFGLETLEIGQSLASKRLGEAKTKLAELPDSAKSSYADAIGKTWQAINGLSSTMSYVPDSEINAIREAAAALRSTQYSDLYEVADKLDVVCTALAEYQISN